MKRITKEEADKMGYHSKGRTSLIFDAIFNLPVGEFLYIEKKEWQKAKTPSRICRYIFKKYKRNYTCYKSADRLGWIISRTE